MIRVGEECLHKKINCDRQSERGNTSSNLPEHSKSNPNHSNLVKFSIFSHSIFFINMFKIFVKKIVLLAILNSPKPILSHLSNLSKHTQLPSINPIIIFLNQQNSCYHSGSAQSRTAMNANFIKRDNLIN
jgi:hypothetical protein